MVTGPKSNEYRVIGGQFVASSRSRMPHRASAATAGGWTRCVDIVSLGKVALSTSSTLYPRRASNIAVGDPPQRAPTTIASYIHEGDRTPMRPWGASPGFTKLAAQTVWSVLTT